MTDELIIELYNSRDERAIEETKMSYGRRLLSLAFGLLRSDEDAQECESDTYLGAWNSIPPVRPLHLFAYLAKICRNAALTRIEAMNAQKRSAELVELTDELQQCVPDSLAEKSFEAAELGEILSAFLKTLSPDARAIFVDRYFLALSTAETAEKLGVGESKVKSTLMRTREKLRGYLEKEGVTV